MLNNSNKNLFLKINRKIIKSLAKKYLNQEQICSGEIMHHIRMAIFFKNLSIRNNLILKQQMQEKIVETNKSQILRTYSCNILPKIH
jgi:hypothetical protein